MPRPGVGSTLMARHFSLAHLVVNRIAVKPRRVTVNGRDWLVCPMTIIVPGVLPGSKGPLFYPPSEIVRNANEWNGTPIVINHPYHNGSPISAKTPGVLDKVGVGQLKSSGYKDKLISEGWFDVAKLKRVDIRVFNSLNKGEQVELSTGLFTDNYPAPAGATYNGRSYTHIARNYRPDHLAVLTDGRTGACSLRDGCGVLVNEKGDKLKKVDLVNNNCGVGSGGFEAGNSCGKGGGGGGEAGDEGGSGPKKLSAAERQRAKQADNFKNSAKHAEAATEKANKENTHEAHKEAAKAHRKAASYTPENRLYHVGAAKSHAARAEHLKKLGKKPTNNTVVHNCDCGNTCSTCKEKKGMPLSKEQRGEVIDELITDNAAWDEDNRTLLESLSDDKLINLHKQHQFIANAMGEEEVVPAKKGAVAPAASEEEEEAVAPAVPAKKKGMPVANMTPEQWYAAAPAEVKQIVKQSLALNEQHKTKLVDAIVANHDKKAQPALREKLMKKDLDDIQLMHDLMPTANSTVEDNPFSPNYAGAAGGPTFNSVNRKPKISNLTLNAEERKQGLPLPTINWAEESKAREAELAR